MIWLISALLPFIDDVKAVLLRMLRNRVALTLWHFGVFLVVFHRCVLGRSKGSVKFFEWILRPFHVAQLGGKWEDIDTSGQLTITSIYCSGHHWHRIITKSNEQHTQLAASQNRPTVSFHPATSCIERTKSAWKFIYLSNNCRVALGNIHNLETISRI